MNVLYDPIEILFSKDVDAAVRYLASDWGMNYQEYWEFAKSVIAERLKLVAGEVENVEERVKGITDGEWREMRTFHDVIELLQLS
jgi:hypothetical protein